MKYFITTLGCKVNQYETQALETLLKQRGHQPVTDGSADVVIVNTCAVTAESGRKSRQAIRRAKADNPGAVTAVCGCFSQVEPENVRKLGADVVFGSGERSLFVEELERAVAERGECIERIDDPFRRMKFELLPSGAVDGRTRAMLKIQDGCDNFCTYCVIPYARGRVRSLPIKDAQEQAREMQDDGYTELVITGIEIASYGKDFRDGTTLADVIEAIAEAAPKMRLRLGSLEPTVVTDEFCRRLAATGKMCRHFHLSLQSGCDDTLRRMNRKYDTARFFDAAVLLRKYFSGCALTADLIVGFPGETEENHAATLDFIRRCAFSSMHIFPYSIRPGTKAAAMDGQHTHAEKERRAAEARAVAEETQKAYLSSCVGETLPVIFETEKDGMAYGHADNYCQVCAKAPAVRGVVTNVEIQAVSGEMLVGIII